MPLHRLSARYLRVLDALRVHPCLSCEQLQMLLGGCGRTLQVYLTRLRQRNFVRFIPARHPNIPTRSLWVLTAKGLEALADRAHLPLAVYLGKYRYSRARFEWLMLRLERVYHIRTFLLQLQRMRWGWTLQTWDVEVEARFSTEDDPGTYYPAPLPGIAQLKNPQGRWVTLALEYDVNRMPVKGERARLEQFNRLITLPEFNDPNKYLFPIWVIVAANRERSREYHDLLLHLGKRTGLLPWTFFITREYLATFYADPASEVWNTDSTWADGCVSFLDQIVGAEKQTNRIAWQALPAHPSVNEKQLELESLVVGVSLTHSRRDLAALTHSLYALDKQVLTWIADHPLLDAVELAFIAQMPARSIRRSITRLQQWGLIEVCTQRRASRARCYVVSEKGVWLLTAWVGLGTAIKTYAHLRGWEQGFGGLVKHWEHTRLENRIYLQFLRAARARGHRLITWYSELESQLYAEKVRLAPHRRWRPSTEWDMERSEMVGSDFFPSLEAYGQNMARFLPDGSGVYDSGDHYYVIAVEVDRSKASMRKMQGKLDYYTHARDRRDDVTWRILFVTTGWRRARHLADLVLQDAFAAFADSSMQHWRGDALVAELKRQGKFDWWQEQILPIYITTIDALNERSVAGKIWMTAWNAIDPQNDSTVYCLECFEPEV